MEPWAFTIGRGLWPPPILALVPPAPTPTRFAAQNPLATRGPLLHPRGHGTRRNRRPARQAEQALVAANRELITRFEQEIQATLARIWSEEENPATKDA